MSWAEVKKTNGNLAKPLDELLTDSESGLVAIKNAVIKSEKVYKAYTTRTTPTTISPLIFTINGVGALHGMLVMLPVMRNTTNRVKFTLTIDSTIVMGYTLQSNSSSYSGFIKMLVSTPELITTYSVSPECYLGMSMSQFLDYDLKITIDNISSTGVPFSPNITETFGTGINRQRFSLINTPIKFNTNLTARTEAINGNCPDAVRYFFIYTLEWGG